VIEEFEVGLDTAQKRKLPILPEFLRPDCSGCAKMDHEVFCQAEIGEAVAREYVPIKINILKNSSISARYNAVWTPSFYFLTEWGIAVWFREGALDTEDILITLGIGKVRLLLPKGHYAEVSELT
jgi:hypothetical protein